MTSTMKDFKNKNHWQFTPVVAVLFASRFTHLFFRLICERRAAEEHLYTVSHKKVPLYFASNLNQS